MPWISLDATTENNPYGKGNARIYELSYSRCKLFKKWKHQPLQATRIQAEDISVYKRYTGWGLGSYAKLRISQSYKSAPLEYEEVYFNINDKKKTPLILVLHFKNKGSLSNRYWKYSQFSIKIDRGEEEEIENLNEYIDEEGILQELLDENDNISDLLTYQIDNKTVVNYNNKKIVLSQQLVRGKSGDANHELTKYKHQPLFEIRSNKSYFLFNKQLLMTRANLRQSGAQVTSLDDVQGRQYNVAVYWSSRVDSPLMLEFNQGGDEIQFNIENSFYIIRNDDSGLYFEKLTCDTSELKDIVLTPRCNIYTLLTGSNNQILLSLLKRVQYNISKILYIMTDSQAPYSINSVTSLLTKSSIDFTKYRLINSTDNISVTNKTTLNLKCLNGTNIKAYEHEFSNSVKGISDQEQVRIKFIIPTDSPTSYNEIKLYKNNSPKNEEYTLYYKLGDKKLYLFFYGSNDSRPLLLFYSGNTYAPKDISNYSNEWYRLENITQCTCKGNDGVQKLDESDKPLLNALSRVIKFLNEISLDERPNNMTESEPDREGKYDEFSLYRVQTYKGTPINIKVTYSNMKCHRVYTHKHDGSDRNGNAYRLGNIKFGSYNISYSSYLPLSSASVYYSVHDGEHKHPLLVALEFKSNGGNTFEYYKLKEKSKKDWEKMEESKYKDMIDKLKNKEKIEEGLYYLRKELKIEYTDKETKKLFKADGCTEDNLDLAMYVGAPLGTLAGVGTIVTIGVVVTKKLAAASAVAAAATAAAL